MPWVCEYCGYENYQDDRVGLKEPACVRCKLQRGSHAAAIEELRDKISDLQEDDRACVDRIRHYKSVIEDLWTELHGFEDRHDDAVREHRDNVIEIEKAQIRLTELQALPSPGRLVTDDQRTLHEVQA